MKKFLIILMTVFLLLPGRVYAADGTVYTEGPLYYTIQGGSITITGCFGRDEQVTIPSSIGGYPVNTIGKDAFTDNRYVKKVNLPDTIVRIEEGAFASDITVDYGDATVENGGNENPGTSGNTGGGNTSQPEKNDNGTKENANGNGSSTTKKNSSSGSSTKKEEDNKESEESVEVSEANFEEAEVVLEDEEMGTYSMEDRGAEESKNKTKLPYIIVVALGILVAAAGAGVYWKGKKRE